MKINFTEMDKLYEEYNEINIEYNLILLKITNGETNFIDDLLRIGNNMTSKLEQIRLYLSNFYI